MIGLRVSRDTRFTLQDRLSVDSWKSVNRHIHVCIDQHSMVQNVCKNLVNCRPTVDQEVNEVLTEYPWRCL